MLIFGLKFHRVFFDEALIMRWSKTCAQVDKLKRYLGRIGSDAPGCTDRSLVPGTADFRKFLRLFSGSAVRG